MVIIPERKAIFLHLPRTSGFALTLALLRTFPTSVCDWIRMHRTYDCMARQFPGWRFFTIMRSPWDILASHYGWCSMVVSHRITPLVEQTSWYCIKVVSRGFEESLPYIFKDGTLCRKPGFYHTYCHPSVKVFQYGQDTHQRIAEWLDIELPSLRFNASAMGKGVWTQRAIDSVAVHCLDDILRFGYNAPIMEADQCYSI